MKKSILLFLIFIPLVIALFYFYISMNIIFSCILFILFLAIDILLVYRYYKKSEFKKTRALECISFMNNFIITLSIKKNVLATFESIENSFSQPLKKQLLLLEHLEINEKMLALKDYFYLEIYNLFLKIIDQYVYNGGDILNISQLFIYDVRIIAGDIDEYNDVAKRKSFEFISLWSLTFAILFILKISLADFFIKIREMSFFPVALFGFFILFMFSFVFFMKKYYNYNFIKGKFYNEKSKSKN